MALSPIYLGADADHEQQVRRAAGVDIARLHVLAQRAAWGIIMGDRVGVDLDGVVDRLLAEFGDQFAAQVTAAHVRVAQGRQDAAREHLKRARELVSAQHPWSELVPTEERWDRPAPAQTVEEVEPGRVYRVASQNTSAEKPISNPGVATFIRVRSGELVCINPVQMDDAVAARVRELGDVTHIVTPATFHFEYVPLAQRQFPKARTYGVPGQKGFGPVAHVRFDDYLDDAAPLFPGEIDQVTMRGVQVGDVWFIDRASGTVLITDSVFLARSAPGDDAVRGPFSDFYVWAWGIADRIGLPSYQPVMWQSLPEYQASLRRALEHEFLHAGSNHGSWHVLERDARDELRRSLAWLLDLSRLQGLGHVAGFVRRHPGMFLGLLRYALKG
jgi:hypothetical protein